MRRNPILSTISWALYAIALFLIYHLLVKPAFLDLTWIALLIFLPLLAFCYYVIHPSERRQVLVFTIGFLLLDRALTRVDVKTTAALLIGGAVAIIVIALLAKWYGRLNWRAVGSLVLIAVLANVTFNRYTLTALSHFTVQYESSRLYNGDWVNYFPMTLYDVDGDGKMEIVTYGNAEELPLPEKTEKPETEEEKQALAEKLRHLQAEPLTLYILTWKDGQMVRMPNEQIPAEAMTRIKEMLPTDYPGFPYYTMKDGQLVPNVQRQSYSEAMMQAGTTAHRAFVLDLNNIANMLEQNQGSMDVRQELGRNYKNLHITNGMLTGTYDGRPFGGTTKATKLLSTMMLPDGREGLIVIGEHLSVLAVEPDGTLTEAYQLTRKQAELATGEFIPADIDHDKVDELLVAGRPSYILKPKPDGTWDILWASNAHDKSFRFSNFAAVGSDQTPEIIAKARSWVSTTDAPYLSGYDYTPEGLKQNWRIYLPLINVQIGDIDGDKQNEIIASMENTHRILVFKQHSIPVFWLTIVLFAGLLVYGVVRRVRHA
ncbi:hypothetical protein P4U99_05840 [Brevibacillus agri]|uniref:hypothetical protein n=1 Tax=Brevibacillus TaxID=55080 RepID=UPI000271BB24|nr:MULTISPECIES: hypothetical protein [Brevibacillus]ELK42667.1 hypothetical protein D478_07343 [Brevibacillus agri BAB-2500]EJL47723.1 hypothetical protein PMI08_00247 [Brevibacillus sp. CF112]MBG9568563.1 membrane protein [Brevibacillus agri]MDN4094637.1 hypothetical protein [Brevibacillus agri]MDR9504404.1 hypothetical protein [Brevibacillus agri]